MTGWNLPPGCNVSDLPGNEPEPPCPYCGKSEGWVADKYDCNVDRQYQYKLGMNNVWTFCSVECKKKFIAQRRRLFALEKQFENYSSNNPYPYNHTVDEFFDCAGHVEGAFEWEGEGGDDIFYLDDGEWRKKCYAITMGRDAEGKRYVEISEFDGDDWDDVAHYDEREGDKPEDFLDCVGDYLSESHEYFYGNVHYALWQLRMMCTRPIWDYSWWHGKQHFYDGHVDVESDTDYYGRFNLDPLENWLIKPGEMTVDELFAWLIKSIREDLKYLKSTVRNNKEYNHAD